MGLGVVRISHELLCDFFTEGYRESFEVTKGLPDDAKFWNAVTYSDHVAFYFKHNSFGACDEIIVELKKFYPGGQNV